MNYFRLVQDDLILEETDTLAEAVKKARAWVSPSEGDVKIFDTKDETLLCTVTCVVVENYTKEGQSRV